MFSYSFNLLGLRAAEVVHASVGAGLGFMSVVLPFERLSRRRFSRYAKVSYASASDCGPTETARCRGLRMVVMIDGISENFGSTSSSLSCAGTVEYCLSNISKA